MIVPFPPKKKRFPTRLSPHVVTCVAAYMQRGDTNVIMVDARRLEAGPWYFTAAQNTWYIGQHAAAFIDYLVSR